MPSRNSAVPAPTYIIFSTNLFCSCAAAGYSKEHLTGVLPNSGQQHRSYIGAQGDVAMIPTTPPSGLLFFLISFRISLSLTSYLTPTLLCPEQALHFAICHCCHAFKYQSSPVTSPTSSPLAVQLFLHVPLIMITLLPWIGVQSCLRLSSRDVVHSWRILKTLYFLSRIFEVVSKSLYNRGEKVHRE